MKGRLRLKRQQRASKAAAAGSLPVAAPDRDEAPVHATGQAVVERRRVSAYCTAEEYDMEELSRHLTRRGLAPALLSEDSIWVQLPAAGPDGQRLEVFYLEFGAVVVWGAEPGDEEHVLADLRPFERVPLARAEDENMQFVDVRDPNKLGLYNGLLSLLEPAPRDSDTDEVSDEFERYYRRDKLTCSYALAKSAKLSAVEGRVEDLLDGTRAIPDELALLGKTNLTSQQINKSIGNLLSVRAYLNLHSDLLDAPDIVWDNSKLETLYQRMTKYLDIELRSDRINRRLDYSKELFDLLRQTAAEKHSSFLEKIIIYLISVEILFNIVPLSNITHSFFASWLGL